MRKKKRIKQEFSYRLNVPEGKQGERGLNVNEPRILISIFHKKNTKKRMQYHFDIMSNKPLWSSGTKKNQFWVNCIPFVFLSKLFRYNYVWIVKSNSKLHTLPMWAFTWSVIKVTLFDTVKLSFPLTQAINKNSHTRTHWSIMKRFGVGSGEFPCMSEGYMEDCCELGRNNFFQKF